MKIACVGGGPAGLYLSILLKRRDPAHEITLYERGAEGSTYGWGVTYWSELLEKLHAYDAESALAIDAASVRWTEGVAYVGDQLTRQPGDEGHGIGRHKLLEILAARARELGVRVEFEREVGPGELAGAEAGLAEADANAAAPSRLLDADLVVAADGVRSTLRSAHADEFGAELTDGRNSYIWLGTTKVFTTFTFAFVETEHGWIWCYGYPYDADHSTCVIECAPETLTGLALEGPDGLAALEKLFAPLLDNHPLTSGTSAQWQKFRTLTNKTWHHGNLVLLGDAAHTTHYSIGAGTTLALEDAMILADALYEHPDDLGAALTAYEHTRKAALLPTQSAARYSAQWYENLTRYIHLPPEQMFALLGQRHSPLLPYVPPQLYYRLDRAAGRLEALRRFKRWLGPVLARTAHARVLTSTSRK